MYFVVLATDYDDTLATHGRVEPATITALERVKASGRKLLLVTGRDLPLLKRDLDRLDLFDLIVCENGALLYNPETLEETQLADPPPANLVERLKAEGIEPLAVGRTIIATVEPNETAVLAAIRDLSLEHHIIFNKGAVMVLPPNINKASGLQAALDRLGISAHNVVGIGDAENDIAFLTSCGCAAVVDNAIQSLKEQADFITEARGQGVIELAQMLVDGDLKSMGPKLARTRLDAGTREDSSVVHLTPFETVLITGGSGSGKSTTVTALLEQMRDQDYQYCVIDPEGDYSDFDEAVSVGDAKNVPRVDAAMKLLERPDVSIIVNLLALDPTERPSFFAKFIGELARFRAETGRPHWLIVDEAHHCMPAEWQPAGLSLPNGMPATIAVTVHPESVSRPFLELVNTVVGVGEKSGEVIKSFAEVVGREMTLRAADGEFAHTGLVLSGSDLAPIKLARPKAQLKRHVRKYAEGELGEDKSFYFRGPKNALKLRAHNLRMFLQIADGVDDETWRYHLERGDYSRWFKDAIKDSELSDVVDGIEQVDGQPAEVSRQAIKEIIEKKYTAPAKGP